ncbi:hypothetical protein MHB43_21055 [Paenibacillus sp. FSL H8-0317]|uniref:hypothetical protein n=1 Tax=unclassified Paenibacillus TaxID=185978 RepID=UPI000CA88127|nr:hypothetical protein PAEAM_16480 [Paenibacillus sp. GM1FR]
MQYYKKVFFFVRKIMESRLKDVLRIKTTTTVKTTRTTETVTTTRTTTRRLRL